MRSRIYVSLQWVVPAMKRPAKKTWKAAAAPPPDDFEVLRELIAEYAEAYLEESWKGGGDPARFEEIETRWELQTKKLNDHIDKMEREYPREG